MWKWRSGKSDEPFEPEKLGRPWGERASLLKFVRGIAGPVKRDRWKLLGELPDAEPADGKVRWAAGALDGIMRRAEEDDTPRAVMRILERVIEERTPDVFRVFYGYLVEHAALGYVDALNELIAERMGDRRGELAMLGRYMLCNAADREALKFAINLVGVSGGAGDLADLLTIGAHDEFTIFAVVAIGHCGGDPMNVWELAQRATGWGRIQCIERLDQEIDNPQIRRWLLTEGYRNSIMSEYSAAICARRGGLFEALLEPAMDDALLDGAAEILRALCVGNPGEGLGGYLECVGTSRRFLELVLEHEWPKVPWLIACDTIRKSVESDQSKWAQQNGWTESTSAEFGKRIDQIRSRSVWHAIIDRDLTSDDELTFNEAAEASPLIGRDPWDDRFERLKSRRDQWYWLLETRNEDRLVKVLEYAANHLDLAKIATGCSDALGFGPEFGEHRKLDWILWALRRWPGKGGKFLAAGLQSPVVRNRNGAAKAILRWEPARREEFKPAVERALGVELNEAAKESLGRILKGEVDAATD